jgi:hypothetical protein
VSYQERAIRVGGYFTLGLLLINVFLADIELVAAVIISLVMGLTFTFASLWAGRQSAPRRYK